MGLFDGKDPRGEVGSTAQVARLLKAPVALVVDAKGMAGSIAPSPWASGTSTPGCGWWGSSPTGWARSGTRRS